MTSFKVIWAPDGSNTLSEAFCEEYQKRTGKKINKNDAAHDGLIVAEHFRRDPVAIAIMEEKGGRWCSLWVYNGPGSVLFRNHYVPYEIKEFPAIFDGFVEIDVQYEGYGDNSTRKEILHVRYDLLLLDLLDNYLMNGRSREWLQGQRDIINEFVKREGV